MALCALLKPLQHKGHQCNVLKGAVMTDGCVVKSKEFACYRADLEPFKGEFDKIRFRAVTNVPRFMKRGTF